MVLNTYLDDTLFSHSYQDDGKHRDNPYLPITNSTELYAFNQKVQELNYENLKHLTTGLDHITNKINEDLPYFKGPMSEFYFKVYASLMDHDYLINLLTQNSGDYNEVFYNLYSSAKNYNRDILGSYKLNTDKWHANTNELYKHYNSMRNHVNKEYIQLSDDNATLLRQGSLNHDLYLNAKFHNKRLVSTVLFISVLILIGFLKSINYNISAIISMTVIITIIYLINMILSYKYQNKMHKLNFHELNHSGYPVRNDIIQQKYLGNCDTNYTKGKNTNNKCLF